MNKFKPPSDLFFDPLASYAEICLIFPPFAKSDCKAGIAQLVEQLICNQQVIGSNPIAGSSFKALISNGLQDFQKFNFNSLKYRTAHKLPLFSGN